MRKLPTFFNRSRATFSGDSSGLTEFTDTTNATDAIDTVGARDDINDINELPAITDTIDNSMTSPATLEPVTYPPVGRSPLGRSVRPVVPSAGTSMRSMRPLVSPTMQAADGIQDYGDTAARAAAIDESIDLRDQGAGRQCAAGDGRDAPDQHLLAYSGHGSQVDLLSLLAGIAWFGEMSARQVGRVWMPQHHLRSVRRRLSAVEAAGFLTWRWWYYTKRKQALPTRYGKLWSLTDAGKALVSDLPTFPKRYHGPRTPMLLAHDTLTTQILVHMIEQARGVGLSGAYIEREVQLNPPERRPIMDAVITLRTGGTAFATNAVPWFNPPHDRKERNESSRKYAIENDRDSEQIAVIIGKAYSYQQAATDEWVKRNGQFPIPVWIVPTEKRRDNIMHAWMKAWPHGKWLMTTDADLIHDRWIEYFDGRMRERRLFA